MAYISEFLSQLGPITLLSDGDALTGLYFPSQLPDYFDPLQYIKNDKLHVFTQTRRYLKTYFTGKVPKKHPPLNLKGTTFQKIVYDELLKVPYGKTITYGKLAKKVALKRGVSLLSSRAVGHAVGQNPVSLIVPCHRVIGTNNTLTGYSGGLSIKRTLLQIEGHDLTKFTD